MGISMFTIKYGSTRVVILVSNYAVKIPNITEWRLFLRGLLGNMQEAKFSKSNWPELCPVIFSIWGGLLLVMRRAEPMDINSFYIFDVDKWASKENYHIPVEYKCSSFGILNGKIVAIDYGS